ncbi:MAG TPA: DUF3090 family protein [Actinomycetota bacterium]|nr:DUF3090 family protein [Actinomycetota bacterium]
MSESFDLDPVERITAGAIGDPGQRTFFVQAASSFEQVTLLAEKEQVRILAQAILQLLQQLPGDDEEDVSPSLLALADPLAPAWRAGEMAIEYDEDADRVEIVIREAVPDEDDEAAVPALEPANARFVASRGQVRAMAMHAIEAVGAGRPRCQLCGLPMENEDEHICPATNGHRSFQE